ncbi:putative metallopeptidase [Sphingobium sp. H39-3-25]|uniref:putative metallopeptidase n=1 Tax=Sphingobium arseniciresistens TaxID=3030834 RepID=UPI0023B9D18E|nr:putative metallopeptidase [Sphingobium arseniciresistens]
MADRFVPATELADWISETFLDEASPLFNPDHAHLRDARLGVLWTNCDNSRNMRSVIGQAELMPPMAMGKWQRARAIQQIEEWFDGMPDFLLTFSAPAAAGMDDASFCALVEHEMYHCSQKQDKYGMPAFGQDGLPSFCIRGHDIEEFVGVVARYGAEAAGVSAMVEAAQQAPLIGRASIAGICGTCSLKAA